MLGLTTYKAIDPVVLALAAAGLLTAQVHANESHAGFRQIDVNAMFEQVDKPLQLSELSDQEMKETEGAVNPYGAIIGGAGGGFGYAISNYMSGDAWSWYGFATSVGGGAWAGSGAGAGALGVIWGFNGSVGAGTLSGLAGYYGW